jgi:steroid delta-isomerase-like uncharacterized protein
VPEGDSSVLKPVAPKNVTLAMTWEWPTIVEVEAQPSLAWPRSFPAEVGSGDNRYKGGGVPGVNWITWSGPMLLAIALCSCTRPESAATSTDPRELFNSFVQAWNRHDYAALDSLVAVNAVEEDLALDFRGEGPEGFKRLMRQTLGMIPDFDWKPTHVLADSFKVAAEWTRVGRYTGDTPNGPVKSKRFQIRGVSIVITNGRRITRFGDYYNIADFYRQVTGGLPQK